VTLANPLGLLGLGIVPILLLLDRWRRRPRPREWPSLLLWRAVAASAAPQRRRFDRVLLYECLAVVLLSLGAGEPAFATASPRAPLLLLDAGPHMAARRADGTTVRDATLAELRRVDPSLRRLEEVRGDVAEAAVRAARDDAVVVGTDRPAVEGKGYVVVGRAAQGDNVGIDAVLARGERVWFALATDGAPRTVRVGLDGEVVEVATGKGFERDRVSEIEVLDGGNHPGDDRVSLRPLRLKVRDGTGSRFVAAAVSAGTPAAPGEPADLVLDAEGGEPAEGVVRGADCLAGPGVFEGLFLDECAWEGARTRPLPGLLEWRGRALAAWLDARTLWLGLPLDREWDGQGTLALVVERAKRERAAALAGPGEAVVGDAIASPAPGLVDTKGVDRPWDGAPPPGGARREGSAPLRAALALLAAAVLALLVRAIVSRTWHGS
jgi:hypothetical protein